jgi:dihydrofolate synthase/folylpolyglutamate synthase
VEFADALLELDLRQPERMVPDLDRITTLARVLGDPQLTYPTIHVTGTNGKTTTSKLITALACAHGLTAGLYTSPHLESVTERITACGEPITEAEFASEYDHLLPFLREVDVMGKRVTYFEVLTALAYLWFADKPVGLGVFEVGMGGKWDATNLVAGDVAVLCPIALDHPELGPTLEDKAIEKAAIIKQDKVAIVRDQPAEVLRVIEARAVQTGAEIQLEDRDWFLEERFPGVGGQSISVRGIHGVYEEVALSLFGEHSAHNAAAAIVALEAFFGRALDGDSVREAFARVQSPGRLEVVSRHPLLVLDGAHNPAGAGALAFALEESFSWDRLFVVMAVSSDKDVAGIIEPFDRLATKVFAAEYAASRSLSATELAAACQKAGLEATPAGPVAEALAAAAAEANAEDLILVTGSLYTVAEARRLLKTS